MKRMLCALLIVFFAFSQLTGSVAESIDLSQYSRNELFALRSKINEQLGLYDPVVPEEKNLLYSDDCISIIFVGLTVEKGKWLKPEFLFINKTDEIIHLVCDSLIVNGCGVSLSKYVDIPANSRHLNEWTDGAEQYAKFKITKIETVSIVFNYTSKGKTYKLSDTQTPETVIEY